MALKEVPATPSRRHPWEVVRARFFGKLVAEALSPGAPARVLDVGAGDGYLARSLLGRIPVGSRVACVDSNYGDADLQRFASPPTMGLSFSRARPAGRFDVILLLNVIEHVADDRAFLDEILGSSLDPRGLVVVSVPAWDLLYGQCDLALKHFRRYEPAQCRTLLQAAGLEIVHDGGLFHSLLLPRVLQRISETALGALPGGNGRRPANLGEWRGGELVSSVVTLALEADTRLSTWLARAGRDVPGLSYFALCRRGSA